MPRSAAPTPLGLRSLQPDLTPEDLQRLVARFMALTDDRDLSRVIRDAWAMGARVAVNQEHVRCCRICGCWDEDACVGGCAWSSVDLCSACDADLDAVVTAYPGRETEWAAGVQVRVCASHGQINLILLDDAKTSFAAVGLTRQHSDELGATLLDLARHKTPDGIDAPAPSPALN